KFKDNAVFNLVGFKGSSTSFNRTQFNGDLFFEGAKFGGILYLTKFKYNKIYIRWIDINNKLNFDDAAYISLMESFKKAGLLEDADNCYYQYRRERRNQPWIITTQTGMIGMLEEPFRKNIDRLLEEFYAYGVDPLRPIYYSMILIIIFTFVWRFLGFGLCKGADKPCRKAKSIREYVEEMRDQLYTMKDPLCFSFLAFLSGTKFIIDPVDLPEQYKELHSARYAFFAEKTLGALFLALLFLSLSRSIIRGS
ncbi:MAG TPA: hypothetical protein VLB04_03940, partial [Methanotrichaceae archaeon]|nr:hypothetical protein [Methanotrichaceae archaeon]